MGSQFVKSLQLLRLNANEIAYPQEFPANTPQRQYPKERKYPIWSYKNITDNQGWIPLKIDYTKFKPKSQNIDASDEVLQRHLKALQKKQQILKQFKYHEDFDRIDYQDSDDIPTYQTLVQKSLNFHFIGSIIISKMYVMQTYNHHYSLTLWKKAFGKFYIGTLPVVLVLSFFNQQSSPANHEFFRTVPKDIRMYMSMAYDADAFQCVNDIKYHYKYPERQEYLQQTKKIFEKDLQSRHDDALKYFKRKYGIIDPEPYLKSQNSAKKERV